MNSVLDDLKNAFKQSNNYLNQLIVINIIAWVAFGFVYVAMWMTSQLDIFDAYVMPNLALSPKLSLFITKPWTLFTHFFLHSPSRLHLTYHSSCLS